MSKILCRKCGEEQGELSEYGTGPNISPVTDALNIWYCVSCMFCGFTGESAKSHEEAEANFRPEIKEEKILQSASPTNTASAERRLLEKFLRKYNSMGISYELAVFADEVEAFLRT